MWTRFTCGSQTVRRPDLTSSQPTSSRPRSLTNVNGTLYFEGDDPVHGQELWKSDGAAAGTMMVKDIDPGSGSSSPSDLAAV